MSETKIVYKKKSQGPEIWRRFKKNRRALVGLGILLLLVFLAVFANLVAPYDPTVQNIPIKLQGPSLAHWMGTDQYGRDILSRVIFGTRISLLVGITSTAMAVVVGGTLGSIAGRTCQTG